MFSHQGPILFIDRLLFEPHKVVYPIKAYTAEKQSPVVMINVNVNVHVYSLISHQVQQTLQFTPSVLELSLIWSHLLWGEFSTFSAANAVHNSQFSLHQVPVTAGWTGAARNERLAQHLYTWPQHLITWPAA